MEQAETAAHIALARVLPGPPFRRHVLPMLVLPTLRRRCRRHSFSLSSPPLARPSMPESSPQSSSSQLTSHVWTLSRCARSSQQSPQSSCSVSTTWPPHWNLEQRQRLSQQKRLDVSSSLTRMSTSTPRVPPSPTTFKALRRPWKQAKRKEKLKLAPRRPGSGRSLNLCFRAILTTVEWRGRLGRLWACSRRRFHNSCAALVKDDLTQPAYAACRL